MVTVTVNGKPVEQYISAERSREIQDFIRGEIRGLRRSVGYHIPTPKPAVRTGVSK